MQDGPSTSDALPRWTVAAAGLCAASMAVFGIANALPTWGFLPRIGPFPSELVRPIMFGLAIATVILLNPFARSFSRYGRKGIAAGATIDALLLIAAAVPLVLYYTEIKALNEGLFFFDPFHAVAALVAAFVIIVLCWREWGAPLSVFGLVCLFYFYTGQYWPGIFETAPVELVESTASDLWFNLNDGILGTIAGIVIFTVLPFILLGSMLEGSGAGLSLIKLSYNAMRRFRGGPAHAAIVASALFGTMSGGAVANVVGTGVLTIPMIRKRGFSPAFSGGVEATASSGGQIMPPIMGAAALVMADFTGISYLTVIVAALVPALAYYASLFATVIFEARRLGVESVEADGIEADMVLVPQDYRNMILIFAPVVTVIAALLSGLSPAGSGITALFLLVALSFLNPQVRRKPWRLVDSLIKGGINFARVIVAVGVIGIITAVLGATDLPGDFAQVIAKAADHWLLLTLILAMLSALLLGMGMPTLPAYLTIILILGPSLQRLGLETLAAHMFVFYYGVASNITPPVALAAFAAAAIAQASPLQTAVKAMRIGAVMFVIPFVFAYYPVLLIVDEAGAEFSAGAFLSIVLRMGVMIYLMASAASGFDNKRIGKAETVLRIALAIGVLHTDPLIHWPLTAASVAFVAWSRRRPDEALAQRKHV
ncbi:TRAP transporter fused permease subunit [Nitratireductor sp. XY-223]|uniref:TRAP transporter permease n=1 Tax=Nitratireductor sp. XY-223 TaxID=2561926 RepID=UPI0010AAE272|nr:TRAP transporter fused permease subunit [Nitratireductor sp. XY-223]